MIVGTIYKYLMVNIIFFLLFLVDHITLVENNVKVVYMLFPLMQRGSLRDVLNERMNDHGLKISLLEVISDFVAICEALNVLHTFKPAYVHQDIKPENILIGNDGKPYLTDFGSVRLADVPIRDRSKVMCLVLSDTTCLG